MTAKQRGRAILLPCALAAAIAVTGCASDTPLVVRTDQPMFYLVLTADSLYDYEPGIRAILANTATPVNVEYRSAQEFLMRRESDDAVFDWREDVLPGDSLGAAFGNYVLAESASTRGLGRRDLEPGDTYSVDVVLDGATITGGVTIPERPRPVLIVRDDGRRMVVWPRVPAAGLYLLNAESDFVEGYATTDTFYVLRDEFPFAPGSPPRPFTVTALDTNLARYRSDTTLRSSGIEGAYGLLGAKSRATIDIPPRATP